MTDRLLELLKNPPRHKSCSSCHYAVNGGNCFKSREKCDEIDYSEWRKQVIAAVEIDRKGFYEIHNAWKREEEENQLENDNFLEYLIANRERWLL